MFYNPYVVSFFGHRHIPPQMHHCLEEKLDELIIDIINQKDNIEFQVGYGGDFYILVSSSIKRMQKFSCEDNSEHTLVLPYEISALKNNPDSFIDFYDNIYICEEAETAYRKKAYEVCNRYMIDNSNLVIFFINQESGGAYKAYKYAKMKNVKLINIAYN